MASTRAAFGLRKFWGRRKSRTPSGERARSRARMPRPKPPPALDPNPLVEEPAGEDPPGAAGSGADPPLGAPAPEAMLLLRTSESSRPPERRSRASVSADAAAVRVLRAPSPATTAGAT